MKTGCLRAIGGIEPLTTAETGKSRVIYDFPLLFYVYAPVARVVTFALLLLCCYTDVKVSVCEMIQHENNF
jgi:hypothetical protein